MAGVGHCVRVSLPSDAPFGYSCQCIWLCACEFVAVSLTVNMTLCTPHLAPLPGPNSLSTSGCPSVSARLLSIPVAAVLFVLSRVEVICWGFKCRGGFTSQRNETLGYLLKEAVFMRREIA